MKLGKQADIRRSAHGDANPSGNRCFRCRYPHEIWRKVGDGTAYFQAKAVQLAHMNTILVEGCCIHKTSINTCTYNIYIYIYICIIVIVTIIIIIIDSI